MLRLNVLWRIFPEILNLNYERTERERIRKQRFKLYQKNKVKLYRHQRVAEKWIVDELKKERTAWAIIVFVHQRIWKGLNEKT